MGEERIPDWRLAPWDLTEKEIESLLDKAERGENCLDWKPKRVKTKDKTDAKDSQES